MDGLMDAESLDARSLLDTAQFPSRISETKGQEMTPPRIPGKRVVWIGGRPVVMSDKDAKAFLVPKRKGKLKCAADRAWEAFAEGKKTKILRARGANSS